MNYSLKHLLLAGIAMLAGTLAYAQVTTSSMNGMVVDESGEVLTGAAVVAVHVPSGTQYATIANERGRFFINGMRAGGPYKVEVSFLGMTTVEFKDVVLKLGEPYELNVTLKSSNELNAVTVISEKSFNANMTGAGSSFDLRTVTNVPTIDRSVYDVAKFTPQASVNKNGGISFSGSNNRYNSFQIDGAVANDTFGLSASGTNGGQTGANPVSLDAIEEIQVVVAPFDVRQSGFTGGAINAITKSGTNTVKGTFYTYFNNQDFIGKTPGKLAKDKGIERTKYDSQLSQTYGFTVGAPIIKNKLFLFMSGEYYKKTRPNIYNPKDGAYDGTTLKEDVVVDGENLGNVFNAKMAEAMLKHYEKTYLGGKATGDSFSQHQIDDRSINAMARIDWNINDANKLMVRYQFMDAYADKYSSGAYKYFFNKSSYKQSNRTNTIVAELNSKISDVLQNQFRATAVLVRDHRDYPYAGANIEVKDNVTLNLGTEYSSGANSMDSNTFTISDNLSWYKGRHEITFGTHNEIYSFNNLFLQYAFGGYSFAKLSDFFNNKVNQFNYRYSDPELTGGNPRWAATTHAAQFGFYAQDHWRVNSNFSLTYGLRIDIPVLLNKPTENADFNKGAISEQYGQKVGTVPAPAVLFSPRVGFRYFLNDDHSTLLRGGAGLFTGRVPFVWISNAYNNTGMEAKSITVSKPAATFPFTSNPYDDVVKTGLASAGGKATINTLDRHFKYPQVFRANLGLEQSFLNGWKFTFDAMFSKTLNNVFFKNLALTKSGYTYGVNAAVGESNPASKAPLYSIDKTYYAVVALDNTNKGYTYSISGQLEKHFNFGLDLMASYTFGHAYSVNDGTSSVAYSNWKYNYSIDTNAPELSHSLFDRPHKIMAVVSYTTPIYLRGLQSTISLSYEAGSGQRYSYTMNEGGFDFNGDGYRGNSTLYIPTKDEVGKMNWADPADAAKFEQYISDDKYLSAHRGQYSERYGGIAAFEHHFDLHFAQDFYYDREKGRKLQFIVDLLNASNLLNKNWGVYNSSSYNVQVLNLTDLKKDADGNMTPTYKYKPQTISISDFYSRWRIQLGFRLTF